MFGAEKLEVERKFDVKESDELPILTSVKGVKSVRRDGDQALDAVYFDTATLELAARRIPLRRRTGGKDAGWHLKMPVAAGERSEITQPLNGHPGTVPPRLKGLVLVHTRKHELIPVAHVKTRRTPVAMLSADGTVLAEFSDDRVESTTLLEPVENAAWREWEIELVDGPRRLFEAAESAFAALGHRPAELPSKLARALGRRYPEDATTAHCPNRKGPASAVLLSYISEQVQALKAHDPGVREGTPDAVHQLRVAARRIRSVLASFRALTEKGTAQQLREELQWLAGAVGTARDLEVVTIHITEAINAEPEGTLTGTVKQHLEDQLGASYTAALAEGLEVLKSDRYFRLLDSLDGFLVAPPWAGPAHKKAPGQVARVVNAERRRLKKAVKALKTAAAGTDSSALHEVRKGAKRLRYAAEAAVPIFGKQATRIARAAEEVQILLGEHQDSVIIRESLRSLATASLEVGAGFTYGRLHALEQQRGNEARDRFHQTWRTSPPQRLHRR